MKKNFFAATVFFASIFCASFFCACNYGLPIFLYAETGVEDRATSLIELSGSELPQIPSGGKYSFAVITDSHFGAAEPFRADDAFLEKFKALLNDSDQTKRPRFIVNLGDTMDGGHLAEAAYFNDVCSKWTAAGKTALGASDFKVYSILGNHDLYNDGWQNWRMTIYPHTSCYKFTLNAGGANPFDFLFLDSGNGTLGGKQIESLESSLKATSRPKIVFIHYPVYAGGLFYFTLGDVSERNRLIADFYSGNVKYVFEGHTHDPHDYDLGSFKEAVVGSYLAKRTFGLVTVDENSSSVTFTRMYY